MKKFSVAWWAYSFPLTVLALTSIEYAQEVKGGEAHALMLLLIVASVLVTLILMVITALRTNMMLPSSSNPLQSPVSSGTATSASVG